MTDKAQMLRQMVELAANEPVPGLDWQRIESRLFEQIDREQPARTQHATSRSWRGALAMGAVAATVTLAVASALTTRPTQQPASVSPPTAVMQGELVPGSVLQAGDQAAHFELGPASFSLSPQSRARVEALSSRVVLRLEQGRLEARVTPQPGEERLVVRAGATQVAVHGTVFSVEMRDGEVFVDVTRGSVAVGPVSEGPTERWLVVAPQQASFSLDGARTARYRPLAAVPSAPVTTEAEPIAAATPENTEPAPQTVQPPKSEQATKAPAPAPLPDKLTPALVRRELASLRQQIERCYRQAAASAPAGVSVSVHTSVLMQVSPAGHVRYARFDPPMQPEAQVCASAAVSSATFPRAQHESTLTLSFQF